MPASRDARRCGLQLLSHLQLVLRFLGRFALLALKYPLIPQLACFLGLFWYVQGSLVLYLIGTWGPAFPAAWTAWIAFLIVIPVFSAIQLLWLLGAFWFCRRWGCGQGAGNGKGMQRDESYMMLNASADEDDWEESAPRPRSPKVRNFAWLAQCVLYAILVLLGLWQYKHYEHPADVRFRPVLQKALADPSRRPGGYARGEKIFIAAAFHQNEAVLPYWTRTMLDTIVYLGADNVYVSIVENYSTDRSPQLLREFAAELDRRGVPNRVLVQDSTVKKPEDLQWNPRIEFLAAIRNQALEPLLARGGYDKVLFSNDIYIEPESVIELLETRAGDFDFACGLDFGHFGAYDMWVLRDRVGRLTAGIWPYFFDTASYQAMKAEEPVPVYTCWNGIVVFKADPLLPIHLRSNKTLSTAPLSTPPPASNPWSRKLGSSPAQTPPLVFRASAEGECYSSESFLLPYDFRRVMGLSRVYANPRVVSAYVWKFYVWHKWVLRQRYVKWFVERVWDGAWMQYARMVVGDADKVWTWEGIDCHPWW